MIFLFFGTSLALLEAELAPFKDWEDIGDICSSSCHRERLLSNSRVASLKQIVIIIIKCRQYINGTKSASRRAREEQKKRKIIRI